MKQNNLAEAVIGFLFLFSLPPIAAHGPPLLMGLPLLWAGKGWPLMLPRYRKRALKLLV